MGRVDHIELNEKLEEVYVKDDAELNAYLLASALENAELHVTADAPPLSVTVSVTVWSPAVS